MKPLKILPFFLCFVLGATVPTLYFTCTQKNNSTVHAIEPQKSAYDYPVKVSVSELKNRTVMAEVRGHKIIADQPKEFGADDKGPTPPELLATSFGTCIVATMQLLATQKNIQISDIKVDVTGTIDFSKAMGQPGQNRTGFQGLTATIGFTSPLNENEKQAFIAEVSKIGAALDTIENPTPVQYIVLP